MKERRGEKEIERETLFSRASGGRVRRLSGFDPVVTWRKLSTGFLAEGKTMASLSPLPVHYPGTWLALQSGQTGSPGIFQFHLLEWH